ncbi:hypothetical protein IAE22_30700, partial [Bacillus sp. S34]|nr:hypothetical protein [Bacillus sp. S34]
MFAIQPPVVPSPSKAKTQFEVDLSNYTSPSEQTDLDDAVEETFPASDPIAAGSTNEDTTVTEVTNPSEFPGGRIVEVQESPTLSQAEMLGLL